MYVYEWTIISATMCQALYSKRILTIWFQFNFTSGRKTQPRDQTPISLTAGRFFTTWAAREALHIKCQAPYSKRFLTVLF